MKGEFREANTVRSKQIIMASWHTKLSVRLQILIDRRFKPPLSLVVVHLFLPVITVILLLHLKVIEALFIKS